MCLASLEKALQDKLDTIRLQSDTVSQVCGRIRAVSLVQSDTVSQVFCRIRAVSLESKRLS